MKKVIFAIVGALALTTVVSSCNKEDKPQGDSKLATPKNITVKEITPESVTLTWDAVSGAELYAYIVDAAEAGETKGETATNEVTLSVATNVEHTFAVKATAAGKTDSDFAQFTIPAQKTSFTATIKVSDITSNSAVVTVTPGSNDSYACVYIDDETYGQITEDDIVSTVVSNVTAGQWSLYQGEQSIELTGLNHSTKYYALVVGFDSNKEPISDLLKEGFTTEAWAGPSDEIKAWLGSYTFTFEKTLRWYIGEKYVESEILDTPVTKEVEIVAFEGQDAALIYGISNLDELFGESLPAIAVLGENNELLPLTGVQVADAQEGYAPTWLAYCYCDGHKDYYFVTGEYGAYTMANGEGTPYTGTLSDQSTFTVTSFAIYAYGDQISFYDFSDESVTEVFHPAGKFTYTKKNDAPAAYRTREFFQMGENFKPLNIKNLSGIKAIEK
ncbi:MAG: hypothetical protein ACI3ZG_04035 [Candidatus Coprenecus sp.]